MSHSVTFLGIMKKGKDLCHITIVIYLVLFDYFAIPDGMLAIIKFRFILFRYC